LKIDKEVAKALVRQQVERDDAPFKWIAKVNELSRLCEEGIAKTHLAFLATAMLAKGSDRRVDLFAIKPQHDKNIEGAFSVRALCHGVLVPLSAEIGFSLGVTGREPLNNQLRIERCGHWLGTGDGGPRQACGNLGCADFRQEVLGSRRKRCSAPDRF